MASTLDQLKALAAAQPKGEANTTAAPQANDDVDLWAAKGEPEESMTDTLIHGAKDLGIGALKGAGDTANNIGHILYPDWLAKHLTGAPSAEQQDKYFAPSNSTQSVGKGAERVGEFFIPGGAEETGVKALTKILPMGEKAAPLARVLTGAVSSGAVNKAQGGGFFEGAGTGAAGGFAGEGMRALAPKVAESAIGIFKNDRAFGRNIGKAALEETKGYGPRAVGRSARSKIEQLTPEVERLADDQELVPGVTLKRKPMSLTPAIDAVGQPMAKAAREGAVSSFNQMGNMANSLKQNPVTGEMYGDLVAPRKGLDIMRGFGDEHVHWNPEMHESAEAAGKQAYGALKHAFIDAVPEAAPLQSRISNLIPVARRAESTARNAPTSQMLFKRIAAPTGALAAPVLMGQQGYQESGAGGAAKGFALGMLAPLAVATPTGQMALARSLYSGRTPRIMRAVLTPSVREARRTKQSSGEAQ